MTLQQLEVFVQVVKTGSFTRAGQALSLTQSAVSHIISSLESELGFTLLHRNRTGISATHEGSRIYQIALEMLCLAERIGQEASAITGLESGVLSVGSFPSFSAARLPDLIVAFRKKYPKIELKIHEGTYHEIEAWVSAGTIDLGFSALPPEGLEFIPLCQDELVLAVHPEHPFGNRDSVRIEELQSQPFIMPKSGCDAQLKTLFKEHQVAPDVTFEIEDHPTILAMVSRGIGLSIVPRMTLSFSPHPLRIVRFTPDSARTIGLLLRSRRSASPAAAAFIHEAAAWAAGPAAP
ncbi:LysR family transcriptional regulator [Gorillibacterium sp. sgz5001074]|uniref:LysR family transcriptional regulator n=1 Tax=Gorillibacterium sp. sgz5001074 TaxID=3446695 RepID=UPI003F678D95